MTLLTNDTLSHRQALMDSLMTRLGLDALVFTSASFFQYATNFAVDVETWERPILCVVPRSGRRIAVLNELSEAHWRFGVQAESLWVNDARFYAEHPLIKDSELPVAVRWSQLAADALNDLGLRAGRVGWEGAGSATVSRLLPQCSVVDISQDAVVLRFVKSEEEVAVMRMASALSDWGQERYRENIRPGRLVQELDASMSALIFTEAANRFPGEEMSLICFTLSGAASAAPHGDGRSVGAKIGLGDVLVNIIEPRVAGLYIENERTWFCGKPSARQVELFEAARRATQAATSAAVVGNPVSAIDRAALDVFERAGVADLVRHRTGHGMGLSCHEYPEDMSFNDRPLMAREVYSAEPGIYEWGLGGFRHDDTVVVGETAEVLTRAPMDLASQTVL